MPTKNALRKQAQRAYPKPLPCELCGETKKVQRHRPNIEGALSVVFLCQKCHVKEEMARGTWGRGLKKPKVCVVCGEMFTKYTHVRVKTCGKACRSELGRLNANKRWRNASTDLED